jgi:hypothetical protein
MPRGKRRLNMLYLRNSLMVLAMAAVSFAAGAQEIYKTVNEDGVVEYSDTPSPKAEVIEVNPNVVETNPQKTVASDPVAEAPPVKREEGGQSEELSDDVNDVNDVNDVDRLERAKRGAVVGEEKRENREAREGVVDGPAHEGRVKRGHTKGARRR